MKAGICRKMWRPAAGVMLVGALTFAVSAQGGTREDAARNTRKTETARQVTGPADHIQSVVAGGATMYIRLTPMVGHPGGNSPAGDYGHGGAYGPGNIAGDTLTVNAGGFRSFWNAFIGNWDPGNAMNLGLRNIQGRVDAMTYINGIGAPLTPAVQACANTPACITAFGESGPICSGGTCDYAWVNSQRREGQSACASCDGFRNEDVFSCTLFTHSVAFAVAGPLFFASAEGDTPGIQCTRLDPQVRVYMGSLALDVPAGAKGTYTIGWIDGETFATDNVAADIPIASEIPGVLVIPTGSCCSDIGPGTTVCESDLTESECNARPTPNDFRVGEDCPMDGGPDCPSCQVNADCNDNDGCTIDTCNSATGVCTNAPRPDWNQATQCCNAANGAICTPTAAGVCDTAACSIAPNRGVCQNTLLPAGEPCGGDGDDNPCTFDDVCDGMSADGCAGTDVNGAMIMCTTDQDCIDATGLTAPTCVSGICDCSLVPDLTIDITPGDKDDPNCFAGGTAGDKVIATVHVAAATAPVNGGQFLITYDPTCLKYNSAVGVAPYVDQVYGPVVNESAGTIFTVVGVGFGNGNGPAGNADMLELSFTKIGDCNSCQICFASNNPQNTYLVDNTGQRIGVNPLCSKPVISNNVITIDVPDNIKQNLDCGQPTAVVSWDAASVTDSCGTSTLTCTGEHQSGENMDAYANGGGEMPAGITNFCCVAQSDWCDKTAESCWTVEVNDQHGLDIEIQLSPTQQSKPGDDLTRCIKFTVYSSSLQTPYHFEQDITFGGLFDFVGKSKDGLKLPNIGQNWDCISAWDQLHTLRSCFNLVENGDCVDGRYQASFRGDPAFGGNWLIGGNLDGWKKDVDGSNPSLFVIDVLDYGTFTSQWGADYGSGDTPCGTPGPNADINGDGLVTLEDYAFISTNFLVSAKECCGVVGLPAGASGITEISVRELREMGLGDLAAGDLNGDGLLNVDDMNAFTQGARPEGKGVRGVRKGSGTR